MIDFTLNKLIYKFRIRDTLSILLDLLPEYLDKLRLIKREEADNIITFINVIIKNRYNSIYKAISLRKESIIYLRLYYNYSISRVNLKFSN